MAEKKTFYITTPIYYPSGNPHIGQLDFHGDEVMEQAKSLLKNKSFDAAREKYKAVLKYEPKNFEAHLGVILCELNISSPNSLEIPDLLPEYDAVKVRKTILNAKKNSDKSEALYFNKMYELINIKAEAERLKTEEKELLSDKTGREVNKKLVSDYQRERTLNRIDFYPAIMCGLFCIGLFVAYAIYDKFLDAQDENSEMICAHPALYLIYRLLDKNVAPDFGNLCILNGNSCFEPLNDPWDFDIFVPAKNKGESK